ncbi:MAG: alpha-glucosidase [Candidatus Binatia bacterium]|nr:alpha-glucosidase [Candidatus Binatia bacterium]
MTTRIPQRRRSSATSSPPTRPKLYPLLALLPFLIGAPACGREGRLTASGAEFPPAPIALGRWSIRWAGSTWNDAALTITQPSRNQTLWHTLPGRPFVTAAKATGRVREQRSLFTLDQAVHELCLDQAIQAIRATAQEYQILGVLHCPGNSVGYSFTLTVRDDNVLAIEARIQNPAYNRVRLSFASEPDERIFGFGEQFTYFDFKGHRVPIVVSEQGIGRGAQPVTAVLDLIAGAGGSWHTTYAPVPHYITSKLRSLALNNTEYATFDLRNPERVDVEVWSSSLRGHLYAGATPLELIAAHTSVAGRMRALPSWVLKGAIVGMQGGTTAVRQVWEQLKERHTPVAAFWLQDWVGQRTTAFGKQLWWNWELDRDRYPEWEALVADLSGDGIRMLTYLNPFLVDVAEKPNHRQNLFREAAHAGFLVRQRDGQPYLIKNTTFSAGLLDWTQPAAREWFIDVVQQNLVAIGISGWMADFGEGLPFDAQLANGDASALHNQYPVLWAEVNLDALDRSALGNEGLFFMRSGFTQSPRFATLFWLGDQMVTWDSHDGIKSAVTGLLSSGLSGFAFNHGDIGGYTTIDRPLLRYRRSRELLLRWLELAAFQVVFRTHEGNLPEANHQFYSDPNTLDWFAYFARLFASWQQYRERLVREAAERGSPVVRHLFLHYPEDPRVRKITFQEFLVGPDLLVAPVLDPGQEEVPVYLPAGSWIHLWSGVTHVGPKDLVVPAPIGQPAVFFREGSPVGTELQAFVRNDRAPHTSGPR